jgi:5,5'-dehydrodivanillate O-demethylase oxygenase subunit
MGLVFTHNCASENERPRLPRPARGARSEPAPGRGFRVRATRTDTSEQDRLWSVGHVCLWPNGLFTGNHVEFRVPVDDANTLSVMWHFSRVPRERELYVQNSIPTWQGPIADPATGRWVTSHVMNQDFVTWVGQGRIADQSQEHLAPSDRGIVMIRRRFLNDRRRTEPCRRPDGIRRVTAIRCRTGAVVRNRPTLGGTARNGRPTPKAGHSGRKTGVER